MPDSVPPADAPVSVPYDEALQHALNLHRSGKLDLAEQLYADLCTAVPDDPNPLHFRGVLLHQRGRDEGLALIQRSIAMDGTVASWHNNLGNVLLDRGDPERALAAYTRCTELDPENFEVLNNLGVLLMKLKRYAEAEETLKRAVARNPRFGSALTNLATLCYDQKRIHEGNEHTAALLALTPNNPRARKMLGVLYATLGRIDEAAAVFREWLKQEPENEQAKHHLAACSRDTTVIRAPERYVEQIFDSFAGSFDAKLAALEYRAPQLIGDAVARLLGEPHQRYRILDAGCGTGLCGPYLAPYALTMVGIDLSGNMLERARSRGLYTQLVKSDLVVYLANSNHDHDVIVSADTLCYFGRLEEVASAARVALAAGGYLTFTVEGHTDDVDYRLNPSGRYSHGTAYIRRVLEGAQFILLAIESEQLRTEGGKAVGGWVVTAQAK